MSNLPSDPSKSPADDTPALPPSQALIPYQTPEQPPTRIEDLDPPYSAYPTVPLELVPYPENCVYALGIRHVWAYSQWIFEKWFNWNLGDFRAIYFNDLINAASSAVTNDDKPRYNLFVPGEKMPTGEVAMYGRVIRIGSFQESTSPVQTILIKTDRPGGTDQDPGDKWHSRLTMSIEGFPENALINQENAAAGVWWLIVRYPNIRKNDKIECSWDGIIVFHTVSPEEAAGLTPIRIWISKAIIDQGGLQGKLILRYRVQDVAENISGGEKYQYSKPYNLVSELDPSLSSPPIFLIDGQESSQVDFDSDSEKTFTLSCYTGRVIPAPNPPYQVFVTLYATLIDGSTHTFTMLPVNATNLYLTDVPVPRQVIEQIVGGSFRASFQIHNAGGDLLEQSGSVTVTVVGTPVSMPGVTIVPIELGLINPANAIDIHLPVYEPHDEDWLLTLEMETREPGGDNEFYSESRLAGPQGGSFHITSQVLQRFQKKFVYFYYLVNDGKSHLFGGQAMAIRKSLEVGAQVGERVASLPAPELQYAQGNNINPGHVPGTSLLLTLPYAGTQSGDEVHWVVVGSAVGGSASGIITVNSATQGKPLVFEINRNLIDVNVNGSLRISYSLQSGGPSGTILRSEILDLTVGVGVQLDRPIIEGASVLPDRLNPLAALAGAYVIVKFRPMDATDQIEVDWLSSDGIGSYTAQLQGNPSTNEVRAFIPPEIVAKGIRPGGNHISVQYRFTRGTFLYESQVVDLELQPLTGLPTPAIDGIGESLVLQLSQLNEEARTRIARWNFIAPNQRMWMTYEGTFSDGTPYVENTYTANQVTAAGVLNGISPPTPVDKLRRLMDNSPLTIRFWVTLSESADKNSAILFGVRNHIIQAIPSTLPRPAFANLSGEVITIDPLTYENNASVVVAYNGMNSTHRIKLLWMLPDGSMPYIADKNGLDGGRVDFQISQAIMASSVGKKVILQYIATINSVDVDSFVQEVNVQIIQPSNLPRPLINSIASGGTLDLTAFTGNATASVAKWRLSATGQRVWLICSSAGVGDLYVLNGVAITAAEAANGLVNKTVVRTWLSALSTGSQITVTCKVTFDGSTNEAQAVNFQSTTYSVRSEPRITATIHTGGWPRDLIASPDGSRVYLGGDLLDITVIDTASNQIIHKLVNVSGGATALHPDGTRLYCNYSTTSFYIINTSTYVRTNVTLGIQLRRLVFNTSGSRLYAINSKTGAIIVLDTATNTIIREINIGPAYDMMFNPSNNRLYVSALAPYESAIIDTNTNQIIESFTLSVTSYTYSPYTPRVYGAGEALYILNSVTNKVDKTISIASSAVAFSTTSEQAYVVTRNANSLTVINVNSETPTTTITGFAGPVKILVLPGRRIAYVANYDGGTVSVVQL